jgi:hypothetical protein
MIKVLKTVLLSAALVGFLAGWTLAQTAKPEHPSATPPPKAGEVKKEATPEHPKADVQKPEHPKAEEKKPEHPKAGEKKPEHPK